jgi:hypothetical protein
MTKSLWTESEAKSLWVEVAIHRRNYEALSADDLDAMASDDLNAWLSDGRMLKDAVCELANQTQMQMAGLWKDAVDAESLIWKQAISRTADDPVEAADDDAIPPEYQTKAMSKSAAVRRVGGSVDTLTKDMDAGRIRFIKVSRQRFIFDSRQVN